MKRSTIRYTASFLGCLVMSPVAVGRDPAGARAASAGSSTDWPQFRGSGASGVSQDAAPIDWNAKDGTNIRWKTRIPGLGHSSPIIWGDRVFVTSSISGVDNPILRVGLYGNIASVEDNTKHSWRVYCLDKHTGKVLWEREAYSGVPKVKRHTKSTHANSTPATDGKHIVAFFGSEGLYCYSLKGDLLWKKDLGVLDAGYYVVPQAQWEYGSSPIIHRDTVIVQCDVQKNPFLAAFRVEDGTEVWRVLRNEVPTWSTPTVHTGSGRTQVIVNGYKQIAGYDVADGRLLWSLRGGGDIPVPTPVVAHDLVYITNAHGQGAPLYAIRTSALGDISLVGDESANEYIAWSYKRRGNYMQTPLVYGDLLYMCRDNGILTCFNAKTGRKLYTARVGSGRTGFTASAVAAGDKIYFTSEDGDIVVVQAGPKFEKLATNTMGEVCMATPAISEGRIYIRGAKHLYCIGK